MGAGGSRLEEATDTQFAPFDRAMRGQSSLPPASTPQTSTVQAGVGVGLPIIDGPLRIVGSDVYDLDRDGDGIACDK